MITLENVVKVYGNDTVAVDDVSFDVAKGDFVFLVGPSGSGKSTLLRLMSREEIATEGDVWVAGRNVTEMPPSRVPYKPRHVISEQVPFVLELVGLADKHERFPNQLSGGEQQRVSIARAFVNRPLIMLADEPTGNLDPATSEGIMMLLQAINETGTTVVMATHDHRVVNMMRRRVIQLDRGVVVRDQERGVYE
jgi:cell division transport system ATP-binding protein